MSELERILSVARWEAYRDRRHCHQRRRAFYLAARRALKGCAWSAKPSRDSHVITAVLPCGYKVVFLTETGAELLPVFVAITLELMQHVARQTKERLDC